MVNRLILVIGCIALAVLIVFALWWTRTFEVGVRVPSVTPSPGLRSASLTGIPCEFSERRPVAVMLSGDAVARPLSGIAEADVVVEMPVAPNGTTRFMAVFQCTLPNDIGSVRSARKEFISLAAGFGAIYVHWGGEHEALATLESGVMNNVNALLYDGTTFYRKPGVRAPHDGFTTPDRLLSRIDEIGYSTDDQFAGYPRSGAMPEVNVANAAPSIRIAYPGVFGVTWTYDGPSRSYLRMRNGTPEVDRVSNEQVRAAAVVVVHTSAVVLNLDYISLSIPGQGDADVYQYGTVTHGIWGKDLKDINMRLVVRDTAGVEIPFAPGRIWIEIVTDQ